MKWRGSNRFLPAVTALLFVFFMAACERPDTPPDVADPFPATPDVMPERQTVDVTLTDDEIDMTGTLQAGRNVFHVRNEGTVEHGFEIEDVGVQGEFSFTLQPGETNSLEVDLQPGDYVVYCPVDDHREGGMEVDVSVENDRMAGEHQAIPGDPYLPPR